MMRFKLYLKMKIAIAMALVFKMSFDFFFGCKFKDIEKEKQVL